MEYKFKIAIEGRLQADDPTDAERRARLVALTLTGALGMLRFPPSISPEFFVEVEKVEGPYTTP